MDFKSCMLALEIMTRIAKETTCSEATHSELIVIRVFGLAINESGCSYLIQSSGTFRIFFTTAGDPAAIDRGGISPITTDPAPITLWSPIEVPASTQQFIPIQTLLPMLTGADLARLLGST